MEGSLQNKLLKHEIEPPPAVWEKLSIRLNEEFVPSDAVLSSRMENASVTPPFGAWENIAASINPQRAKVIPLVYRRIAVAAAVAGLIAVSAVYFLNNNDTPTPANTVAVNNNAVVLPAPQIQRSSPDTNTEPSKTLIASNRLGKSAFTPTVSARSRNLTASEAPYLTYAELEMEPVPVQTVAALQPVEVEAPLIRDARGNIIMDLSVISKPNDPYITVTSPSGLQTRISNKFLHCLSYLNGNSSTSGISYEGQEWKTRFEEWRNKLLSEGAFVPAANNFFDIFELQALIEEQ